MWRRRPLLGDRGARGALDEGAAGEVVTLAFDGEPLTARAGEPVSAALLRAGILATSRSAKYRRLRGPYCLRGECGSCQVRIAGEPNHRACMTPCRDGLAIESQNHWGPAGLDPTPMIDTIFRSGVDHHHLMVRPRLANEVMQRVARTMTGFGTLPENPSEAAASHRQHTPEVLIVGAGATGRAAACALEGAGVEVLTIDRWDRETLERNSDGDQALPRQLLTGVGVFGAYPHEGLWAAARTPAGGEAFELHTIRPRQVILATGARDPLPPLVNNDLPGIFAGRGLLALLRRADLELRGRAVVIGVGDLAAEVGQALAAEVVAPEAVVRIVGGAAVTGVELRDRTLPCELVALAPTPAPTHELAAQAGARLRWDGAGFAVVTDGRGEVLLEILPEPLAETNASPLRPPWRLWAGGDLCGWRGPARARDDGLAIAAAILTSLGESLGETNKTCPSDQERGR